MKQGEEEKKKVDFGGKKMDFGGYTTEVFHSNAAEAGGQGGEG
jgi:hypothetical protein